MGKLSEFLLEKLVGPILMGLGTGIGLVVTSYIEEGSWWEWLGNVPWLMVGVFAIIWIVVVLAYRFIRSLATREKDLERRESDVKEVVRIRNENVEKGNRLLHLEIRKVSAEPEYWEPTLTLTIHFEVHNYSIFDWEFTKGIEGEGAYVTLPEGSTKPIMAEIKGPIKFVHQSNTQKEAKIKLPEKAAEVLRRIPDGREFPLRFGIKMLIQEKSQQVRGKWLLSAREKPIPLREILPRGWQ